MSAPPDPQAALPVVRQAVKDLLVNSSAFHELPAAERRELAASMVKVCQRAAEWLSEEIRSDAEYQRVSSESAGLEQPRPLRRLALAQAEFGEAARRVADTTRDVLTAVSFPRFVTELINGVFKAMVDSSQQQMHSFVELLRNVSATTEGFADANLGPDRARVWLAEQYPGSFELVEEESDGWDDDAAPQRRFRLQLRGGAEWPPEGALRTDLGLAESESVPRGDPESTLLPLARRALARQKQQMLASMVLMGLQRIVIESGRIHASMRFHIDTRSALAEDRGSSFDLRNTVEAAGNFGAGPWGVSASVQNTIGYVSTERSQSTEELNTELDLNSSVEIVFRTDHVPLEILAGKEARERIKVNTLNPDAELKAYGDASGARRKAQSDAEIERRKELTSSLKPAPAHKSILPEVPKPMPEATKKAAAKKEAASEEPAAEQPAPEAPAADEPPAEEPASEGAGVASRPLALSAGGPQRLRAPDVVWVPTPPAAVDVMLELADPKPGETLYDLGCGDARIVIAAAREFGCKAVGIDIDPRRIRDSRAAVRHAGVADRVQILHQDLFTADLSRADIVTLYLLPELNRKLLPQLRRLRPGARIISHDFVLGDIPPERTVQIYAPEQNVYRTFYRWLAPLPETESARPQAERRRGAPSGRAPLPATT